MFQYWLIAIGFLCAAINLEINGLGILLPTCVGYALIAAASWALREVQKIYLFTAIAAGIMAVLMVPELFRSYLVDGLGLYDEIVWWGGIALDLILYALLAISLFREASIYGINGLRCMAALVFPVAAGCIFWWWHFPVTDTMTFFISTMVYSAPMFLLAVLYAIAAKTL